MATDRLRKKIGKGRHASTIKRQRQSVKRQERNKNVISTMRSAIKTVKAAIAKKDKDTALTALKKALPIISRTAQKRVIHKSTADRYRSRLTIAVNQL